MERRSPHWDWRRGPTDWMALRSFAIRSPHRELLRSRSLVLRGRAVADDPLLACLVRLPDWLLWHVIAYWRATDWSAFEQPRKDP